MEHPRIHTPQQHLGRFAIGYHFIVAGHGIADIGSGHTHIKKALAAYNIAGELQHTAGADADHLGRFGYVLRVQLHDTALVHLLKIGHVLAVQHQIDDAAGCQRTLIKTAAIHLKAECHHKQRDGKQKQHLIADSYAEVDAARQPPEKVHKRVDLLFTARRALGARRCGVSALDFNRRCRQRGRGSS